MVWLSENKIQWKNKTMLYGLGSFVTHVKAEDIYKDIAKRCHKMFDTSNYQLETALPK